MNSNKEQSPAEEKMNSMVMVIGEDDISTRELVSLLQESGIDAATLKTMPLSLMKLGDISPDAVIVEEESGSGGWEISSKIRNSTDIPIILLGNVESEKAWVKAASYGVDCYLARPFNPLELVARIRALVRRHESTKHRFADSLKTRGDLAQTSFRPLHHNKSSQGATALKD